MHIFLTVVVLGFFLAYVLVAAVSLWSVMRLGRGWRATFGGALAMRPWRLLRHAWRALLFLAFGVIVLPIAISGYHSYFDYLASPACGEVRTSDCRDLRELQVSNVEKQYSKSGDETVISFGGGYGTATFYSDDVAPSSVESGGTITAEVWRGQVTAVVIDGTKHLSFASESEAWIGIVVGAGLLLIGLLWLAIDISVPSMDPDLEEIHNTFIAPSNRRRALYILLILYAAFMACLGLAYVAILARSVPTASVLAAIYFIGGFISVPLVLVVFVAWFVRAYLNMGALGLRIRHSAWFVGAALLVPPLSLYMPSRLMGEVVAKTQAGVGMLAVTAWWLSGLGFVALTIIGASTSSADAYDTSPRALTSDVSLAASVIAGIVAAVLSLRLIHAVDASELDLARAKALSA